MTAADDDRSPARAVSPSTHSRMPLTRCCFCTIPALSSRSTASPPMSSQRRQSTAPRYALMYAPVPERYGPLIRSGAGRKRARRVAGSPPAPRHIALRVAPGGQRLSPSVSVRASAHRFSCLVAAWWARRPVVVTVEKVIEGLVEFHRRVGFVLGRAAIRCRSAAMSRGRCASHARGRRFETRRAHAK